MSTSGQIMYVKQTVKDALNQMDAIDPMDERGKMRLIGISDLLMQAVRQLEDEQERTPGDLV